MSDMFEVVAEDLLTPNKNMLLVDDVVFAQREKTFALVLSVILTLRLPQVLDKLDQILRRRQTFTQTMGNSPRRKQDLRQVTLDEQQHRGSNIMARPSMNSNSTTTTQWLKYHKSDFPLLISQSWNIPGISCKQ